MPKFSLGQVYITPKARHHLTALGRTVEEFLGRHAEADWGDIPRLCARSSMALAGGSRVTPLLSFYKLRGEEGIYIITNPSRTHTAVSWRTTYR